MINWNQKSENFNIAFCADTSSRCLHFSCSKERTESIWCGNVCFEIRTFIVTGGTISRWQSKRRNLVGIMYYTCIFAINENWSLLYSTVQISYEGIVRCMHNLSECGQYASKISKSWSDVPFSKMFSIHLREATGVLFAAVLRKWRCESTSSRRNLYPICFNSTYDQVIMTNVLVLELYQYTIFQFNSRVYLPTPVLIFVIESIIWMDNDWSCKFGDSISWREYHCLSLSNWRLQK